MNCLRARVMLSAYIDSELMSDEMLEIRNHIFVCESCSAEYNELRTTKSALSSLKPVEPDESLLKLIACKPWQLQDEKSTGKAGSPKGLFFLHRKKFVPALVTGVCFLLLACASIGIFRPQEEVGLLKADNLSDSFKAEHERYVSASPLSGNFRLDPNVFDENILPASNYSGETRSSDPFVVAVSVKVVR